MKSERFSYLIGIKKFHSSIAKVWEGACLLHKNHKLVSTYKNSIEGIGNVY